MNNRRMIVIVLLINTLWYNMNGINSVNKVVHVIYDIIINAKKSDEELSLYAVNTKLKKVIIKNNVIAR